MLGVILTAWSATAGGCEQSVAPPGHRQPPAAQPHPVLARGLGRPAEDPARPVPAAQQRGHPRGAQGGARQRTRHAQGALFPHYYMLGPS